MALAPDRNALTCQAANKNLANPSKRPNRTLGDSTRAKDQTTTTDPSRLANMMWVASNGCTVPGKPQACANAVMLAYTQTKVHGTAKGQVTSRSYQALARTMDK